MSNFTLTAQNVNGDPFISGNNINITNNATTDLIFIDVDNLLGAVLFGEYVSLDGGLTTLSYQFLGYGYVRGDPFQLAGFIRIDLGDGTFLTVALDMNADGDRIPNLSNGNTGLKVVDLDTTSSNKFPKPPPCFARGTLIETAKGLVPVETLGPGDMLVTHDDGLQPVVWAGSSVVSGLEEHMPVLIRAGALGNHRDMRVSPQHNVLIRGWRAELHFGEPEVLVAAKHLVNGSTILREPARAVSYHHVLLERHGLVMSEGSWTESFFPGEAIMRLNDDVRRELSSVLPDPSLYGAMARPVMPGAEARAMGMPLAA